MNAVPCRALPCPEPCFLYLGDLHVREHALQLGRKLIATLIFQFHDHVLLHLGNHNTQENRRREAKHVESTRKKKEANVGKMERAIEVKRIFPYVAIYMTISIPWMLVMEPPCGRQGSPRGSNPPTFFRNLLCVVSSQRVMTHKPVMSQTTYPPKQRLSTLTDVGFSPPLTTRCHPSPGSAKCTSHPTPSYRLWTVERTFCCPLHPPVATDIWTRYSIRR